MEEMPYLAALLGYLLGSIPFGLLLAKLMGKGDLRDVGSGNIGATNAFRAGGKPLGVATLLLDIAKGAAAVVLAGYLWEVNDALRFAAAGALIGHLYPVWLKFKGGKGVATYLGVLIPLMPVAALIFVLVWIGMLVIARISSVAGMTAAISAPVTAAILGDLFLFPMLLGFTLLILWRHQPNIRRLAKGAEPKVGGSKD